MVRREWYRQHKLERQRGLLPVRCGRCAAELVQLGDADRECADMVAPEIGALIRTVCHLRRAGAADDQRGLTAVGLDVQTARRLDIQRVREPEDGRKAERHLLILGGKPQKRRLALWAHVGPLEGDHAGDDRLVVGRQIGERRGQGQVAPGPVGVLYIGLPGGAVAGAGQLEQPSSSCWQPVRCAGVIKQGEDQRLDALRVRLLRSHCADLFGLGHRSTSIMSSAVGQVRGPPSGVIW